MTSFCSHVILNFVTSHFSCDWANKINELDDATSYSSAIEVIGARLHSHPSSSSTVSDLFAFQSLSRLFDLVREEDFPVPCLPGKRSLGALVARRPDVRTGCELMVLSESVLVSFSPHLLLLLNPQAKGLLGGAEDQEREGVRHDETAAEKEIPAADAAVDTASEALVGGQGD
jgi:hypothetical protein